jgi:hypothetical protein
MKKKDELFTKKVIAGTRTYFMNVKKSVKGEKYLVIHVLGRGEYDSNFENRIIIFEEYIDKFEEGFKKAIEFIKSKNT